jgi:hypothetical protein
MPSISFPWTMSLIAKRARDLAGYFPTGLVGEFDAELTIDWWGEGDGEYGWELSQIAVEWTTPPDRFVVDKDSDPDLWKLIMRGFKADEAALSEKILERIDEALSDEIYEAAE